MIENIVFQKSLCLRFTFYYKPNRMQRINDIFPKIVFEITNGNKLIYIHIILSYLE